jgi:hypothetical protein
MFKSAKSILIRSQEIDRGMGQYAERLSRFLWPWPERWLLVVVGVLCVLDFMSTYAVLELSGRSNVYERGNLAAWALVVGGFPFLLLVDAIGVVTLSVVALVSRHLYIRYGHSGYGRAAFVFILIPYIIIATFAVLNNIILIL